MLGNPDKEGMMNTYIYKEWIQHTHYSSALE